jgi:hypothetical protein
MNNNIERTDFYTQVHKWQRANLFALSNKVSGADFTDSAALAAIHLDLKQMTNELRQHALNEETFVHPLLARKIPHAERTFEQEHTELKKYLTDLETSFIHLRDFTPSYEKSKEQGLEFYRTLNRFIATYLTHINEEEYVMQNLWEVATEPELKSVMIAFQTNDGEEKGHQWLETHLTGMNNDEQQLLFRTSQLIAPAHVFSKMCQLTEKILGIERWQQIAQQL